MQDPPAGVPPERAFGDRTRPQPHERRRTRRLLSLVGLALMIGAAAWVATLRLGGSSAGPGPANLALGSPGSRASGPAIGQLAPDFVSADAGEPLLQDLDGHPIRLADFAGKPLWIVFWATWCTPCQQEAADIRAAYHEHEGDLAVLAIDVQEPAAAARAFAQSRDLDYAIGLDPTAAVKALYGGWGLPAHFFVGADGVIRDRYLGQMTADLMELHLNTILPPT
jgi:cytochrome c biogenesis protein CcmG, thiol:disulfide interchange protein DsbE